MSHEPPSSFHPTRKQAHLIWMAVTGLAIGVMVALLVTLVWGLGKVLDVLSPVLWPIAIAGILAYLLDPVVRFFERRRVPRSRAIVLVFVLLTASVVLLLASIVPRLIHEATQLQSALPEYAQKVQETALKLFRKIPLSLRERVVPPKPSASNTVPVAVIAAPTNVPAATSTMMTTTNVPTTPVVVTATTPSPPPPAESRLVDRIADWASSILLEIGQWMVRRLTEVVSLFHMFLGLAMVPVFTFYFLAEKKGIARGWTHYLPMRDSKFKDEFVFVVNAINNYLIVFFRGQVVVSLINGILLTIAFTAIGLNYALIIGLIAGTLSIVPYLGTIMTIVPAVLIAGVQFRDWFHPLLVIAIFSAVQLAEGLFISPKIMGDRVGLHPLTVIIAVLVGTTLLGGILGGILAIPLTAALRVVMFRYVWQRPGPEIS